MQPLPHQLTKSKEVFDLLRMYKYAYINGQPRSGKTLTSLLAISYSKSIKRILFLTKKSAISGIHKFTDDPELKPYWSHQTHTITNYESIGRYITRTTSISGKPLKKPIRELQLNYNPDDFDLVILDEAHRLGKLGKPSQTYQLVKQLTGDKPFLAMSGTPIVESPNHIYYQMSISTRSPFQQPSFYRFFDDWGIPTYLKLHGRMVTQYKQAKPELLNYIDKFTVTMTQIGAGIDQSNQAQDHLHYIEPSAGFIRLYNQLLKDKILPINNQFLVCDSTMKLRTSLHQMEGGTVLIDQIPTNLNLTYKLDYIKQTWPDSPKTGIMCYYVHERDLLKKHFPNSEIYSSISHAEGVDLSHLDNFIIFSFGFSGAKFVQLRNRAVNVNSQSESKVHILLTKNSISMQVYESVKNKQNFNDSLFLRKSKPI